MKFHETAMRGRFPTSTNRVIWHFKSRKKSSRWPFLIFHECHNYLTTHHSKIVRYDTVQYTQRLSVCNTKVCWLGVDLSSSMWINNVDLHKVWCIFYTLYAHEHFWMSKFEVSSKRMHLYIYMAFVACETTSIRRLRQKSPYRLGSSSTSKLEALTLN